MWRCHQPNTVDCWHFMNDPLTLSVVPANNGKDKSGKLARSNCIVLQYIIFIFKIYISTVYIKSCITDIRIYYWMYETVEGLQLLFFHCLEVGYNHFTIRLY